MACLDRKEMNVGELAEAIESPLSTVSRHLTLLKNKHLVKSRQEGTMVFYSAADRRIIEACALIRSVLIESMKRRGLVAKELDINKIIE